MVKPKKKKTEGDMTPMIDCVFLLLIFFIIAAKFITPEGHLDFWQPKDSGQSDSRPIELEELQDVRIYARGGNTKGNPQPITLHLDTTPFGVYSKDMRKWKLSAKKGNDLASLNKYNGEVKRLKENFLLLTEKLKNYAKSGAQTTMVINIDPEVPYIFVVEAMNACSACNLEDVKFSAQKSRLTKQNNGAIKIDK